MYDDGLAFHHAFHHRPAALRTMYADGHATLAIGMTGADNGHREALLAPGLHQQLLAGYLVARILPMGIGQRGTLGDDVAGSGFVVG